MRKRSFPLGKLLLVLVIALILIAAVSCTTETPTPATSGGAPAAGDTGTGGSSLTASQVAALVTAAPEVSTHPQRPRRLHTPGMLKGHVVQHN
jgi:hypothetical protein